MSEWKVQVVKVGALTKHPNADRLMTTRIFDYPIITGVGEFQEGDLAVYVPVDSVMPADDPRWAFLQGHLRIKAKRLRGIFSMGLLTKVMEGMKEGDIVADQLRIIKYEPPLDAVTGGKAEYCPFEWPKYTDLDSLRRYPDVLREGEEVVLTEKLHGTSAKYVWRDGRLWVGSHNEVKKDIPGSVYWGAAAKHNLAKLLESVPGIVLYGEVYGWVMDLRYGHNPGTYSLALFDAMDLASMKYLDYDALVRLAQILQVPMVPALYRGPWKNELRSMAEGDSLMCSKHVREGFVVKPVIERFDDRICRVILKYHGEGYLTRKEKD